MEDQKAIPPEEAEQLTKEAAAAQPKASICPCCGKPTLPYPVAKIPDDLLDQFMACMISGQPFSHVYEMYDGRIQLTIAQLTPDDRDSVTRCLQAVDSLEDHAVAVEDVSLQSLRGYIRTLISVQRIVIKAGSHERVYTPADGVRQLADSLKDISLNETDRLIPVIRDGYKALTSVETASAMPPAQLLAAVEAHARLLDILLDAGFGPSFWKGIELA